MPKKSKSGGSSSKTSGGGGGGGGGGSPSTQTGRSAAENISIINNTDYGIDAGSSGGGGGGLADELDIGRRKRETGSGGGGGGGGSGGAEPSPGFRAPPDSVSVGRTETVSDPAPGFRAPPDSVTADSVPDVSDGAGGSSDPGFFGSVRSTVDSELRQRTGGSVGLSDDFTSTDDAVEPLRESADAELRERTGGSVGISDDFTSTEQSGGVGNVAAEAGEFAFGGEEGAFGESGVSPTARMSLNDPEAIEARAVKEQDILANRDADSLGELPGATAANLFGLGQRVEQAGIAAGEGLSNAVPSAEVGPEIGDETIGEVPSNIAGGGVAFAGMGAGAALQLPASAAYDIDQQVSGGQTPTEVEGGTADITQNFAETQATAATRYPLSTAAGFALPGASGTASSLRGFRATRATSGRVSFGDITSSRGSDGGLPQFETSPGARTGRAVDEIETRAGEQPDAIDDITGGENVLFHSTDQPFGRGDFEVGEGASELPGLFTSPDASPLGLSDFGQSRSSTTIGFSDFSTQPEAVPGFVPRGVEGIPRGAGEAGYAVRGPDGDLVETGLSRAEANRLADETGGDRATDPTTSGFEFLTEEAPTETGLVRPQGARTTELEAILAPDSQFQQTGAVGVELPDGRTVRSDIFSPIGESARGGRGDVDGTPADGPGPQTAGDISTSRSPTSQPDIAVDTTAGTVAGAGSPSSPETGFEDSLFGDTAVGTQPTGESTTGQTRPSGGPGRATSPGLSDPGGVFGTSGSGGQSDSEPPITGPTGPTSSVSGSSTDPGPSGPPPSVPGSPTVSVSEPSSPGAPGTTESPMAGTSDPFGVPIGQESPSNQRRRRDSRSENRQDQPDRQPTEAPAASPLFSNPIAGVFDGFGFGQGDGGQDLGPFG